MSAAYLSNWISNGICVKPNVNLSYKGRAWMPAIFDTKRRFRLLKTSRQVGKSTGGTAESTARMATEPYFNVLYVAPEQDQSRKFSRQKVGPMIQGSPVLRRMQGKPNNIHEKGFTNGSKYFLLYAKHNPDAVRGVTADMVHYDEIQDQDLDKIRPVIEEAMLNSEHKLRLFSGTPKSFSHPPYHLWQESDRREWIVTCHGCQRYNNLGVENIGKSGPVCKHCGKDLDVDNGQWVRHNRSADMAGFHVHQMHCKVSHRTQADWDDFLYKFENYDDWLFLNEVLGISADTAEMPITRGMLYEVCNPEISIQENPPARYTAAPCYAGIDWGHESAATALSIGQFKNGRFRYLFMKKYEGDSTDPRYCIPDMVKYMKRYKVERAHADYGGGFGLNDRLVEQMGRGMVTTNYWSGSAIASDQKWSVKNRSIPRLTLNKSKAIGTYIKKITDLELEFPRSEDFMPEFAQDFINVRKDRDHRGNIQYIKAGPGQNDDLFQACVYAYAIARQAMSGLDD